MDNNLGMGLLEDDFARWKKQSEKIGANKDIEHPRDIDQVRLSAAFWQDLLCPAGSMPPKGVFEEPVSSTQKNEM